MTKNEDNDLFCCFGYWVGPCGEIVSTSHWQSHYDDAPDVVKKFGISCDPDNDGHMYNSSYILDDLGWVSVTVNQYTLNISFSIVYPSALQAAALAKCLRMHARAAGDGFCNIGGKDFTLTGQAIAYINEKRDLGIRLKENPPKLITPKRGLTQ